ncbi:hypothetical protein ABPG74_022355 [Tetrahymena malaccensis]
MSTTANNIAQSVAQQQQQQQQVSKNMLSSVPLQLNKDQALSLNQVQANQANFQFISHRKQVSTNERQNFSSSPVKITSKAAEISPLVAANPSSLAKLNLFQTVNDPSYYKKIIQAPTSSESNQIIPIGQPRPLNLTTKYIRNFSQFLIEIQKNKQESQYLCSHCKDLLWDPVKCTECPTYYCHSCASKNYAKQNKKCNTCQKILITIRAGENILKQLQKINLMCPNSLNGCQAYLSYNSYELHQQDCRFKKSKGSENLVKPPIAQESKKRESAPIIPTAAPAATKKEKKDLVSCIHCYKNVLRQQIEQHQNSCPLKLIPCQFCKNEVPSSHLSVHVQYRCTKTIFCSKCSVNVPYEQFNAHIGNCNIYPSVKCSFCDQNFYKSSISDHIATCSQNPTNKQKKIMKSENLSSNKKYNLELNSIQNPISKSQPQNINSQALNNNLQSDQNSLLIKGMTIQSTPSKACPSSEKLKFMIKENMYKTKGNAEEQSFDHDLDQDRSIRTKMNTDASLSTEQSQNNINMYDAKFNSIFNNSLQMNTTMPLSPLPVQSKFKGEVQTGVINFSQNMHQSQKQQSNLIKPQIENPESYSSNQQNSYKINSSNNIGASVSGAMNAFMSPQMTSSTRLNQAQKLFNNQINPALNTILQHFLNKNDNGGRSNSFQVLSTAPSAKIQSSQNLETKS